MEDYVLAVLNLTISLINLVLIIRELMVKNREEVEMLPPLYKLPCSSTYSNMNYSNQYSIFCRAKKKIGIKKPSLLPRGFLHKISPQTGGQQKLYHKFSRFYSLVISKC